MPKKLDIKAEMVQAMRGQSLKWDWIVRILEDEKKAIDNNIHSKKDDEGRDLDAKQIYDLATWYGFLDYVVGLPAMILDETKPRKEPKEPSFETYDSPVSEVRRSIIEHED